MVQILAIGIVAGLTAALMFGAAFSGVAISIPFAYLSGLPIALAALGWSPLAGLVAAVAATGVIAGLFGGLVFLSFLIVVALPAWWLSYLALLARPIAEPQRLEPERLETETAEAERLEWYPVGRIVVWAAVLGPLPVLCAIPYFGTDPETFQRGLKSAFEHLVRTQLQLGPDAPLRMPGGSDPNRTLDVMVAVVPPLSALLVMLASLVNVWLAGRVARISGRLKRPWPTLSAMVFPPFAPLLLAGAVAGTFLSSVVSIVASAFMASMLLAYVVLGFAVLHAITVALRERPLILGGVYATAILFGWTMLVIALIGLAETLFAVRLRVARRRGLPMSFE